MIKATAGWRKGQWHSPPPPLLLSYRSGRRSKTSLQNLHWHCCLPSIYIYNNRLPNFQLCLGFSKQTSILAEIILAQEEFIRNSLTKTATWTAHTTAITPQKVSSLFIHGLNGLTFLLCPDPMPQSSIDDWHENTRTALWNTRLRSPGL